MFPSARPARTAASVRSLHGARQPGGDVGAQRLGDAAEDVASALHAAEGTAAGRAALARAGKHLAALHDLGLHGHALRSGIRAAADAVDVDDRDPQHLVRARRAGLHPGAAGIFLANALEHPLVDPPLELALAPDRVHYLDVRAEFGVLDEELLLRFRARRD